MILRTCVLFIPVFVFAQEKAPPEVEQELHARVNAFYQNFVNGSPRKAESFVAEDTKDWFYNAGKPKYESFKIGKMTFSDNFTKAIVNVSQRTEKLIAGQAIMMDVPVDTHWKIEEGKWCYTYHQEDYSITPMGGSNPPAATGGAGPGPAGVKPKNGSPESVGAAGRAVLEQQQMGLDKSSITMTAGQAASAEVIFTNGADGEIQIALDGPVVRGLAAKLDKMTVPGHGTAVLSLRYDPTDKNGPPGVWEPKGNIPFRVVVAPFSRNFPINLTFLPAN